MITQNQNTYEGKKKRKAIAIVLCLTLALTLVIGSLFAYFSDMFYGDETMTAGTLTITGGAIFYINGEEVTDHKDLECINPGDEITVEIDVENTGSKSAWIQGSFGLSAGNIDIKDLLDVFSVYHDAIDDNNILLPSEGEDAVFFEDDGDIILDGTTEKETAAGAVEETFTSMTYIIVFDKDADNEYQDVTFTIEYMVKALQYRNNTDNSALDWGSVQEVAKITP